MTVNEFLKAWAHYLGNNVLSGPNANIVLLHELLMRQTSGNNEYGKALRALRKLNQKRREAAATKAIIDYRKEKDDKKETEKNPYKSPHPDSYPEFRKWFKSYYNCYNKKPPTNMQMINLRNKVRRMKEEAERKSQELQEYENLNYIYMSAFHGWLSGQGL